MADLTMPIRIQRQRKAGWHKPDNTTYVGRGSIWGNPFIVGQPSGCDFLDGGDPTPMIPAMSLEQSLDFYREMLRGVISPEMHPHGHQWIVRFRKRIQNAYPSEWARTVLRGKNLMCWCQLSQKCHADILLEVANG